MENVERSQKTDLAEFYAVTDLSDFEKLRVELECWQFFYNWQRPHGSLKGKTPSEVLTIPYTSVHSNTLTFQYY